MLQDRINELFTILETGTGDIAVYAKCTPSTISRLRSGSRNPGSQSTSVTKLIDGMVQYATENNKLQTLMDEVNVNNEELIREALKSYLFSDTNTENIKRLPFSEKLDKVMSLCEMPNIKLSKLVNVDSSYISRFRKGIRSPKSNPELFNRICVALFDQLELMNRFPDLIELMNSTSNMQLDKEKSIPREELYLNFHAWMNDFDKSDRKKIDHLLGTINTFSPNYDIPIPPLEMLVSNDIINDNCAVYEGIKGLQQAVLRFLGCAIKEKADELLLYSDQGMEWMINDTAFRSKWAALMALCIKGGTHIKIIHNIDRDITEMIEAIESWLPLYATGMIESFYNKKPAGNRFKHTLFLYPGKACITSCHPSEMDELGIYNYHTDALRLDFYKKNFDYMMKDAVSLVNLSQGTFQLSNLDIDPHDSYNSLSLSIASNKVVVVKNSPPKLTMTLTHPLLCNAFQAYLEHRHNDSSQDE